MRPPDTLKLAELSRLSGVHRSTIHHYLNLGLLPPPRVLGPKIHLFDAEHVEKLRDIQRLRSQGSSLRRIQMELASRMRSPPRRSEPGGQRDVRKRLLEQATRWFAERGYDGDRVGELARSLGIGKATVYRHFPTKQALFVECVERVCFTLIPRRLV